MANKRKTNTNNQDALYFAEVDGLCPLCGNNLMSKQGTRYVKMYEIAHIYPCNPTIIDLSVLADVQRPADTEAFENKIALCLSCHQIYDHDKTLERYNDLKEKKNLLIQRNNIKKEFYKHNLEEEISRILSEILNVTDEEIEVNILNMKALQIKEKIEDEYKLLRREVENNATKYFQIIQNLFKSIDDGTYENITLQVRSFYLKCKAITSDKNSIYDYMIDWIKMKSKASDDLACAIIVSYFIQNCEVFDAIS